MAFFPTVWHWGLATWTQHALMNVCTILLKSESPENWKLLDSWLNSCLQDIGSVVIDRHDQRYAGSARCILAILTAFGLTGNPTRYQAAITLVLNQLFSHIPFSHFDSLSTSKLELQRQTNALDMLKWLISDAKLSSSISGERVFLAALNGLGSTR